MLTNPSIFKRVYDGVALFALLNLFVVGGLLTYLIATGSVDGEKIHRIAQVLQGEEEVEKSEPVTEPVTVPVEPVEPATAADAIAESQMQLEIMRREADRIKTELDQRLALNNSIMLRVMAEREAFQAEQSQAAAREEAANRERETEGFEKQVRIYEGLAPKVAVEHLLGLQNPDEAARLLLEMDTRKAKKIVEAAKRPDQLRQMKLILQRLREVAPDRSSELHG
jgi:hypothetical protein